MLHRTLIGLMLWTVTGFAMGQKPDDGFVSLFDGTSLSGWQGAMDSYTVEDGAIVCRTGTSGNLFTSREYRDFVLQFEFRLAAGSNNGLGIRCPLQPKGNLHLDGIEIQVLDDSAEKFANLKPYQYHGSVYGVIPAKRGSLKPVGEWNRQQVTLRGTSIKVEVNEHIVVDADWQVIANQGTPDDQAHPGLSRKAGYIGFLGHGDRVDFRNIRLRELSSADDK